MKSASEDSFIWDARSNIHRLFDILFTKMLWEEQMQGPQKKRVIVGHMLMWKREKHVHSYAEKPYNSVKRAFSFHRHHINCCSGWKHSCGDFNFYEVNEIDWISNLIPSSTISQTFMSKLFDFTLKSLKSCCETFLCNIVAQH